MSDKVTFRGAKIRYFDGRRKGGASYVRIHLTAEMTQPVVDAMGWEDPGESVEKADLEGELVGTHFELKPNEKKLHDHAITLDINKVDDFKLIRITEDEVTRRELRFVVRSPSVDAVALVDGYLRAVGETEAALTISYTVQAELPLKDEKPAPKPKKESTGCKACDAGIPLKEKDDAEHVDGNACKVWGNRNDQIKVKLGGADGTTVFEGTSTEFHEAVKQPTEPSLAGATPAERKQARRLEEERKKALRGQGAPADPQQEEEGR